MTSEENVALDTTVEKKGIKNCWNKLFRHLRKGMKHIL